MSCVMVTAFFEGLPGKQKDIIYNRLLDRGWIKAVDPGEHLDTLWYKFFTAEIDQVVAVESSVHEFNACSKPYCKPKLALHWGPGFPQFSGLHQINQHHES